MQLELVSSQERFRDLRGPWLELADRAARCSIFMTWEWQYYWWQSYGGKRGLRLLAVWEGGQLVGVLAAYLARARLFRTLPVRCLKLIGTGRDVSPDDLGLLVDPEVEGAVSVLVCNHLLDLPGWDVLTFTDLWPSKVFDRAIVEAASRRTLEIVQDSSSQMPYVRLPATWDDYLSGLSRSARYRVRRRRRDFARAHDGRFFVWRDGTRLDAALDRLVTLHRLRWEGRADTYAFSSPAYVGFHRQLLAALWTLDRVRLYCLQVGGDIIAMYLCYRYRNGIYYFQGGFDPAYERSSPGSVLMGFAIEDAIREGNDLFDMLKGVYRFKLEWAPLLREGRRLLVRDRTWPARVHRVRYGYLPRARQWVEALRARTRAVSEK